MKTRERILVTALELFNICGEPNVSTVDIANEMNISPGNLYYHFRNKEEIVRSIFDTFEHEFNTILDISKDTFSNIIEIWLYIKLIYEKIWHYRFIYRDLNNLIGKTPFLDKHIKRLIKKETDTVLTICISLKNAKQLHINESQLDSLVDNIVFKLMFWINHVYTLYQDQPRDISINTGVHQLMSLLEVFLNEESKGILKELRLNDLESSRTQSESANQLN